MKSDDSNRTCLKWGAAIPADAPQGLSPRCVPAEAATAHGSGAGDAASAPTSDVPSLDRVRAAFPHLEVIELVGRGGMGFVFKARQPHLDRLVALKLLPDRLARDPQFAGRFNRERRVLARLNHPTIGSVFDFGRTEHFHFPTMEFVDGVNRRQAMQAGRFSPAEALGIAPKICEARQYAHEQGVLHRDIKPENILRDAHGPVKTADLGIAKLVEDDPASVTLAGTGAALGTPHYMAPEQLEKPVLATLTWPLRALLGATLGSPVFLLTPGGGSGWAYTGLLVVLYEIALVARTGDKHNGPGQPQPTVHTEAAEASVPGTDPLRAQYHVPAKPVVEVAPATPILGGSTNWETGFGLAAMLDGQQGSSATNTPAQVRISFTAVLLEPRGLAQRLVLEYAREGQGADFTILSSGRFPGETVNLTGATYAEGGSPSQPRVEGHWLGFDLPRTLARADAEALRQRLADKWLGHPLVAQPGDQHTLFAVPAADGTEVKVTILGRLPALPR